jgi:hypothetical protein
MGMTHVYLTETEITAALKARAITEREAKELNRTLKRCLRSPKKPQARLAS